MSSADAVAPELIRLGFLNYVEGRSGRSAFSPRGENATNMGTTTDFVALVRNLRDHLGLTQEQFAQQLGLSFSTVNVWESGRREPLPFLRRRLLEMAKEAGLISGVDGPGQREGERR
jgi:DNA-binding XRE family transcriptional regulator